MPDSVVRQMAERIREAATLADGELDLEIAATLVASDTAWPVAEEMVGLLGEYLAPLNAIFFEAGADFDEIARVNVRFIRAVVDVLDPDLPAKPGSD